MVEDHSHFTVKTVTAFSKSAWEGWVLDIVVVVLIVCLAAGYLVHRYIRRSRNLNECACENTECPLRTSGSEEMENFPDGMPCEGKECSDDPFHKAPKTT